MARKTGRKRRTSAATRSVRSEQAKSRPRGVDGKFLTKAEIEALDAAANEHSEVRAENAAQAQAERVEQKTPSVREIPVHSSSITTGSELDAVMASIEARSTTTQERTGKSALERSLDRKERRLRLG